MSSAEIQQQVDAMASDATSAGIPPKRRWMRYGLRTVFALLTITAIGSAWIGWHVNRAQREDRIIAKLRSIDEGLIFNVNYDNAFRPRGGRGQPELLPHGPAWLTTLLGTDVCRTVTGLQCVAPGNTFAISSRRRPSDPWHYEREYVRGVRESELREIAKLTNLRGLGLEANPVTDEGLAILTTLQDIEWLSLSHTMISDDGVQLLAQFPKLTYLSLESTDITDASVESLAQCANLRNISLGGTHISRIEVERLKQLLPDCTIEQ